MEKVDILLEKLKFFLEKLRNSITSDSNSLVPHFNGKLWDGLRTKTKPALLDNL